MKYAVVYEGEDDTEFDEFDDIVDVNERYEQLKADGIGAMMIAILCYSPGMEDSD